MRKLGISLLFCLALVSGLHAQTDSLKTTKQLQEFLVAGIRATEKQPIPLCILNRNQIVKLYYGADIPTLLQLTPSVNTYSDNGTGIGYSYFRLRGMDQTRINTTINGIPVNDPENQGVYFNNFADLASSAEDIQVQRGIGTSSNGSAAFGGSVAIQTRSLSQTASSGLTTGFGSFGSSRLSAELQTGLLGNHFMVYARLGQVKTNGYRNNSAAQVQSYQFSIGYQQKKSFLKFNFIGGNAANQLAYVGIDKATFNMAPKTNLFNHGESDAFKQYFNQMQYTYWLRPNQSINVSLYLVKSQAPKFQYLFQGGVGFDYFNMLSSPYITNNGDTTLPGSFMSSYRLDQTFIGGFATYNARFGKLDITAGLHINQLKSQHFMEVNWADVLPAGIGPNHQVYFNTGFKNEQSAFVKLNYDWNSKLSLFTDIQVRRTNFRYTEKPMEFRPSYGSVEPMNWLFVNPRFGAKYLFNKYHSITAMAGMSSREPTRFDYFQDDYATHEIKQNEIKQEQVIDIEIGYTYHAPSINAKVNLFAMNFQNQIVATGALNNFGYAITGNIGKSFRRGIEIDLQAKLNSHLSLGFNSALSNNTVAHLSQTFYDEGFNPIVVKEYKNSSLALSPRSIQQFAIQSAWFKNVLAVDLMGRYVSMQYLDNTAYQGLSLPAFHYLDAMLAINLSKYFRGCSPIISFRVNNLLNQAYASSGSVSGYGTLDASGQRTQTSLYFPAATRNFFVSLSFKF